MYLNFFTNAYYYMKIVIFAIIVIIIFTSTAKHLIIHVYFPHTMIARIENVKGFRWKNTEKYKQEINCKFLQCALLASCLFSKQYKSKSNKKNIIQILSSSFRLESVTSALFSSIFFCKLATVALSFVFDKYYLIMD